MKTTKILLGAVRVSALIALFAVAMPAQAQTVNLNFNSVDAIYTGTGAAPDTGTYWNSVQWARNSGFPSSGYGQTASSLLESDGHTSSSITVSLYDAGGYNPYNSANHAAFADPLLSDEFYGGGSTIAITGLTPGGNYDLYLYSENGGHNSDNTTFTFGTSLTAVNNATGDLAFTPGVNYVEFALTADGSGDITGSYSGIAPGIDGLQIEAVAAPEPSTYALVALGAGMLMLRLRRKGASLST
jgi:hypothetical protein